MSEEKDLKTTVIQKVIVHAMEQEKRGWPPGCAGFYYQPDRPCNRIKHDMTPNTK
jgi:hypothetical protein